MEMGEGERDRLRGSSEEGDGEGITIEVGGRDRKVQVWNGGRRRQVETGRKWKWRARWRLESRCVEWRQTEASGDKKEMEMESKMEIGKQMEVGREEWGYCDLVGGRWEEDGDVQGDADRERDGGGKGWEVKGDRHGEGY